jgi:hypothetical protein
MNFTELVARILPSGLFRTGDILAGEKNPNAVRSQLMRWVNSGKIVQLRREVYLLQKPYCPSPPHPFLVANLLRRASYVSLESALSHYGMIPEYVPVMTSITGARPEELDTPIGRYVFRHVNGSRFFGFHEVEITPGQRVRMATPEKALLDLLYLTPGSDQADYLVELRLERPTAFDDRLLMTAAEKMGSPKVQRAINRLFQLWRENHETALN